MKVVLYCEFGMSTSLLVTKMKAAAEEGDVIDAFSLDNEATTVDKYDVALLGPQVRGHYEEAKKIADEYGVPCLVMDMRAYGTMNGQKVYEQAKKAYLEKHNEG